MSSPHPARKMRRTRQTQGELIDSEDEVQVQDAVPEPEPGPSSKRQRARRDSQARRGSSANRGHTSQHPFGLDEGEAITWNQEEVDKMNTLIEKYKEQEARASEEAGSISLSSHDMDTLTGRVVRYMLFAHQEKAGHPVPRAKLLEVLNAGYKEHKHAKKLSRIAIPAAQARMIRVFGIEMREIERVSEQQRKGKGADDDSSRPKLYVLRSVLPKQLLRAFVANPIHEPSRALTLIIMCLIKMSGDKLDESALWSYLKELGVQHEGEEASSDVVMPHPIFSNIKEELTRMEATRYIVKSKKAAAAAGGTEGLVEYVYERGEAGMDEIPDRELDAFMDKEFSRQLQRMAQATGRRAADEEELIELD
mmetsp:Transcript_12636/g.27318  ORF Transcript_12636/g.27318 Transcript_12636/m.27318 type:complete len:365 (+) Transcript_12636:99-1193(+)